MNKEYLLTPVIEVNDGEELKSFRIYYLFIIAFFFGLVPAMILCIRNCLWLRTKKTVIFLLTALSILALTAEYMVLGSYYNANLEQLKEIHSVEAKGYSQNSPNESINDKATESTGKNPAISNWEEFKSNIITFERIFALLLITIAYVSFKEKYKIVMHLTGNIQPLFKWAVVCIIAGVILERVLSSLFLGGIL